MRVDHCSFSVRPGTPTCVLHAQHTAALHSPPLLCSVTCRTLPLHASCRAWRPATMISRSWLSATPLHHACAHQTSQNSFSTGVSQSVFGLQQGGWSLQQGAVGPCRGGPSTSGMCMHEAVRVGAWLRTLERVPWLESVAAAPLELPRLGRESVQADAVCAAQLTFGSGRCVSTAVFHSRCVACSSTTLQYPSRPAQRNHVRHLLPLPLPLLLLSGS